MDNIFIFTEIANCGKIGKVALDSFHKYHNYKVYVYGTKKDFDILSPHKNNILIEVPQNILDGYKDGHIGTALLWEKVIEDCDKKYILHFDSDVIFRENIIDEMIEKSKEYDIIGPIRNYHHNPNNRNDIRYLTDLCQTNCTIFNLHKISKKYYRNGTTNNKSIKDKILALNLKFILHGAKYGIKKALGKIHLSIFAQMIHGSYPLFRFNTLDFFDQVMFDMIENGAKIYHLDFNEVGGCDKYGKRDNDFKSINNFPTEYKLDFGSKLVHFSCVGSGMNFYNNKDVANRIDSNYVKCALDRYALFCKIFYQENLNEINLDKYKDIINIQNWY